MGLRAGSARPQRVSGSARTDSQRAQSARNPIASHVNFDDDSAPSAFTRTQWTAAFRLPVEPPKQMPRTSSVNPECSADVRQKDAPVPGTGRGEGGREYRRRQGRSKGRPT